MKTTKQTKTTDSTNKKAEKKKGSTAAAAKSMDMPAASGRAKAREGRNLPNEGTITSYEEDR